MCVCVRARASTRICVPVIWNNCLSFGSALEAKECVEFWNSFDVEGVHRLRTADDGQTFCTERT